MKWKDHFDLICQFNIRLIEYSPEIEEIDIHNNTIGNMSATLLINALQMRHLSKLSPKPMTSLQIILKKYIYNYREGWISGRASEWKNRAGSVRNYPQAKQEDQEEKGKRQKKGIFFQSFKESVLNSMSARNI